ncbi:MULTISPECIES: methylated-DNA--[protein]-cysteine S-methyltransferase [Clostridium]|uniref:methylated-DNA--[protein]-cysteine S-methyltransferase n=1 Tax=Clostridium TaxID=1485 RepID=UPI000825F206|nr:MULTISPECIES: methylated-DNA--[protein]-cysteine S-methyltransferase [Clostridium]PJI08741.1 methylated-DNA--[protein]-cysteine S-methyltransferase [Clostridium sp. CT7]
MADENIEIAYYESPIGNLELKAFKGKLCEMNFIEDEVKISSNNALLQLALKELDEYFKGKRKEFDLELLMSGSEFQKKVWGELMKIPYGSTVSYGEIAEAIGNKNASRAVGNANNKNKIPIIIPCHRVIGKSGKLVGYAGGIWRKQWLIDHEK